MSCEKCGGRLGHPNNGDRTCELCKRGVQRIEPGRVIYFEGPPISKRRGGWVVEWETELSGPWKTAEAAELARQHDYHGAHAAERKA